MIVVIADDLSGAAELGGVARRHGLTVEVQTRFAPETDAEVVCVDSTGRALSPAQAADAMAQLIPRVLAARPEWIYLKFDSVLRGNILVQLRSALTAADADEALLITANPSRGRIIRGGEYLVDGVRLHETAFASDPEYPCTTSSVRELLGHPSAEIVTPDIETPEQLAEVAAGAGEDTLLAGSAEFFAALLRVRQRSNPPASFAAAPSAERPADAESRGRTLMICGSLASWGRRSGEAAERGVRTFDIFDDPSLPISSLEEDGTVLIGIGERPETRAESPSALVAKLADLAAAIIGQAAPDRLMLEGGATAAGIVRHLGWTRLAAQSEVGHEEGALRPVGPYRPMVFIKPGSYDWPESLW